MSDRRSTWLRVVNVGAIGGVVSVFIALTGMVTAFSERYIIGGILDMGRTLILIALFVTAQFALRRAKLSGQRSGMAVAAPALAGMVNALFLALLVLILTTEPTIRTIFVNATPKLVGILTYGQDSMTGILLLLGLGVLIGALTGLMNWLPGAVRSSLITAVGLTVLIGLLQELLTVTFQNSEIAQPLSKFLFASSGLEPVGAIVVFVTVFVIGYLRATRGGQVQARVAALPTSRQRALRLALIALLAFILLILPQMLGLFFSEVLVNVGLFVLMGLGLNIVVGFAGLLDLGYVAFYAIGAYSVAVFTSTSKEIAFAGGFPFWVGLPIAVLLAVTGGVILGIPVLKVRGDYLAIVTLGFGEIVRFLVLSDFLKPYFGGSRGVELIPRPFIGSFEFKDTQMLYYIVLAGCLLVAFVSTRVKNSRIGRAWMAMREDEDVAQAMGINLVTTKLLAFGMGASFAGIGGAIFASKLQIIYPHSFNFIISINVLALIIVGGMGSIPGVIVGGLALVGLPELLREFADFRYLVYGAVLVLMMIARPEGLWPEQTRLRELHEAIEEEKLDGLDAAEREAAREG